MRVLLHVLNKVAPGSHLRADVQELRDNRQQKMPVAEQVRKTAVIFRTLLMFALDRRELRSQNNQRPDNAHNSQHEIWLDHSQAFRLEISGVEPLRLFYVYLFRSEFDSREDEHRADQHSSDGANRIESLRKVEPLLRSIRIAKLCNKRVRRRLQE